MFKVDIFYIATGEIYVSYFQNFINSIGNFLPGHEKRIHIISDLLQEYDGYNKDGVTIDVHYQINMPYPIIPLMKTYFIKQYAPADMEYGFYFDADTIFLKKEDAYWDWFRSIAESGDFMATAHPNGLIPKYSINEHSKAYLSTGFFYYSLITSFYGGKAETLLNICDDLNEKIKQDLTYHENGHQLHYIPPLFDQDYMNKIAYEKNISFNIRCFVYIFWLTNSKIENTSECFIEQKYDARKKNPIKNLIIK